MEIARHKVSLFRVKKERRWNLWNAWPLSGHGKQGGEDRERKKEKSV